MSEPAPTWHLPLRFTCGVCSRSWPHFRGVRACWASHHGFGGWRPAGARHIDGTRMQVVYRAHPEEVPA